MGHDQSRLVPNNACSPSGERRERLLAQATPAAQMRTAAELVLAADQFIIKPAGRVEDAARAQRAGDEVRTVIAGYHWFTDWGRDTMISLEGLTLSTGRHARPATSCARSPRYIRDGLIPNLFPEGENEGLYHTADATLWFFHALERYLDVTSDRDTLRLLLPKLDRHRRASPAGARASASASIRRDGLLAQGAEGYQLTWMDAKVGDWVVTPRRGKAVEINALWYNALRLLKAGCARSSGDAAPRSSSRPRRAGAASRSTSGSGIEQGGYLYDVVDGETRRRPRAAGRISYSRSRSTIRCSTSERWQPVLDVVQRAAAHAGRAAVARAGRIPTTRPNTTATCGRATPPIIREPCGRG